MSFVKLISGVVYASGIYGLLLFLPAGTLNWWRAWILLGVTVLSTVISTVYLSSTNPEILRERWKPPIQEDQPLTDKVLIISLLLFYFGSVIMTPLDVFRWHLLPRPGLEISSLGLVFYISSWIIITWVLRENAFASAVVRYQPERQHRVIDTGPYRIVRHPMYAGAIPLFLGLPLWLESYAATIAALLVCIIMVIRIRFEEKFLLQELPGYPDYVRRVKWRLIPGIW